MRLTKRSAVSLALLATSTWFCFQYASSLSPASKIEHTEDRLQARFSGNAILTAPSPASATSTFSSGNSGSGSVGEIQASPRIEHPHFEKQQWWERFSQQLHDYRQSNQEPDDKEILLQTLREMNASKEGQSLLIDLFYASDSPALAATVYDLVLDADLKDPHLIVALINRDATEFRQEAKSRLLDLVADLNSREDAPHHQDIEDFLANLALHPDPQLRNAAKSQWAWYLNRHKHYSHSAINEFLLDDSPEIRQEMYEIINMKLRSEDFHEHSDIALSLNSLLVTEHLNLQESEKTIITALLQTIDETKQ